jgi:hypothetical protein
MILNALTRRDLTELVKAYNLHFVIKNYSKLNRQDLINKILEYLYIDEDFRITLQPPDQKLKLVNEDYNLKSRTPYTNITNFKKSFSQTYKELVSFIKNNDTIRLNDLLGITGKIVNSQFLGMVETPLIGLENLIILLSKIVKSKKKDMIVEPVDKTHFYKELHKFL